MTPFEYVCCVFAVWRISRFLRKESGPGNALSRMRDRFIGDEPKDGSLADFLSCNKCQSVWIALLIVPMVYRTEPAAIISGLMLVCIFELGVASSVSPAWCNFWCKLCGACFVFTVLITCLFAVFVDATQSLYMPFAVSAPTFFIEYADGWNERMAGLFVESQGEEDAT